MGAKYYTCFRLRTADASSVDEYSGVVEINCDINRVLEPGEIEAMLARNFDLDEDRVEVLNWAPLH